MGASSAGRFRAAFDGGSRGNPGAAAWGVAVVDEAGECVERHGEAIGRATNNVAEYHGLLGALRVAVERGASDVRLLADSELIVKQLKGVYRVRHPDLQPLYRQALALIERFDSFSIEHVRRERNKDADRLVNRILDRVAEGETGVAIRERGPVTGEPA